jgi:hypothetical protein
MSRQTELENLGNAIAKENTSKQLTSNVSNPFDVLITGLVAEYMTQLIGDTPQDEVFWTLSGNERFDDYILLLYETPPKKKEVANSFTKVKGRTTLKGSHHFKFEKAMVRICLQVVVKLLCAPRNTGRSIVVEEKGTLQSVVTKECATAISRFILLTLADKKEHQRYTKLRNLLKNQYNEDRVKWQLFNALKNDVAAALSILDYGSIAYRIASTILNTIRQAGIISTTISRLSPTGRTRGKTPYNYYKLREDVYGHASRIATTKLLLAGRGGFLIEPPIEIKWEKSVKTYLGGFHTKETQILKKPAPTVYKQPEHKEGLAPYIDFINSLQAQPWQINPHIYKLVQRITSPLNEALAEDLTLFMGVPRCKPLQDEDTGAVKAYKTQIANTRRAKILSLNYIQAEIQQAEQFDWTIEEPIYFTYKMCERGRVYPSVYFLSPQGAGFSKAMLQFYKSEPLSAEGRKAVQVYLGKLLGLDKMSDSINRRGFEVYEEYILKIGKAVYEKKKVIPYQELWKGEEALYVLAHCVEYYMVELRIKETYNLPVHLDGTCNGLQHISALLRDEDLAAQVNVVGGSLIKKADIYQECVDLARYHLKTQSDEFMDAIKLDSLKLPTEDKLEFLSPWLDYLSTFALPRSLAKSAVMTTVYNATARTKLEAIIAEVHKEFKGKLVSHVECGFNINLVLSRAIYFAVNEVTKAATENYLKNINRAVKALASDAEYVYRTPLGLAVRVPKVPVFIRQKPLKRDGVKCNALKGVTELDRKALSNETAPGIVHSIDAAHMIMTTLEMKKETPTAMSLIHDSFGVEPNHYLRLKRTLKETFHALHSSLSLKTMLHPSIAAEVEGIEVNSLDLDRVLKSNFMFH